MRKFMVVMLILALSLAGCAPVKTPKDADPETTGEKKQQVLSEYADSLGDAIVAHYLGREVSPEFKAIVGGLPILADDNFPFYLGEQASAVVRDMISEAILMSMTLPGSPDYVAEAVDRGEASGGGENPIGEGALEYIKKYQEEVFPGGRAPSIPALDTTGKATDAFKKWFLSRAVELGWLDSRLHFDSDARAYVLSGEYRAGDTYSIKGVEYEAVQDSSVVTTNDIKTDLKFDVNKKSYKYFDSGDYQAIYETRSGVLGYYGITVSFKYIGGNASTLNEYLLGVTNLSVRSN